MGVVDLRLAVSRLDSSLRQSLELAVARAVGRGHASVEIDHWLLELAASEGPLTPLLAELQVSRERVVGEVAKRVEARRGAHGGTPSLAPDLINWIEAAWSTSSLRFGRERIAPVDLLVTLTTSASLGAVVRDMVPSLRIDEGRLIHIATAEKPEPEEARRTAQAPASAELDTYTVDLTADARAGRLDPINGRDPELRQVIDVLMRRRQNNPILVGEAGVGKTALVEALALRIVAGEVPEALADVRVLALDLGLLQAGAGVKGEFERRLTAVIAEIKASPVPVILFIDEAHTMIGAGNQAGQSDAANLLKPALARGELRTIAATTWSEYKRHIERDPALTRRFQVVKVAEPAEEIAVHMLRALVPALEKHHGVRIREAALVEAVRLSARYLPDRQLPDKAVSVLDTAAAAVTISRATSPAPIEDLSADKARFEAERAALLREGRGARSARIEQLEGLLRETGAALEAAKARFAEEAEVIDALDALDREPDSPAAELAALERRLATLQGESPLIHRLVDREAVASVVGRWTGVPVGRLMRDAMEAARSLDERLRERIKGQDAALKVLCGSMRTAVAKLADPTKPPGVFLMAGTSGIGKTETALALADLLYGGAQHLTVINMSEFKEEHKVSSLVGAPPGYVGYGEGGVLTEAVRRRPYGILLLDEVEKAHAGVQDVFYQVFDKGMLRDGEGRDIDFRNTAIILTTNAGSETLAALAADPDAMPEGDALVDVLKPELLRHFKPAFIGRVSIVPFLPLSEATLREIALLQLGRVADRLLQAHATRLLVDRTVEARIVSRCIAGEIGARAIDALIKREILPAVSDFILDHAIEGTTPSDIHLVFGNDGRFHLQAAPSIATRTDDGDLLPSSVAADAAA